MMPESPRLLTFREAAERLGMSERWVWERCADGTIPVVRLGRCVRIDPGDLEALVARSKGRGR